MWFIGYLQKDTRKLLKGFNTDLSNPKLWGMHPRAMPSNKICTDVLELPP